MKKSVTVGRLKFGHWPARDLTHPYAFQYWRGSDERDNPSISVGIPFLGAFHVWFIR